MLIQLFSNHKKDTESGFSLIEIMVVIAIVGIIASLAVPSFLRSRTEAKLRGAASNLKGDLELAKMRAIRENAYVVIMFSASGYTIYVDNGESPGNWVMEDDEFILRDRQLPEGVRIEMPTPFADDETRFLGRGTAEDSGLIALHNLDGDQKNISINRMGKITLN